MDHDISRERYQDLVEDVRVCVRSCVPAGAVVLIASKGDPNLLRIDGVRDWHFPRVEWGSYAGHHPASSVEAIVHLRHLFSHGARYLVFPETAGSGGTLLGGGGSLAQRTRRLMNTPRWIE